MSDRIIILNKRALSWRALKISILRPLLLWRMPEVSPPVARKAPGSGVGSMKQRRVVLTAPFTPHQWAPVRELQLLTGSSQRVRPIEA